MFVADRRRLPADFETLRFISPVLPATIAVALKTLTSIVRGRRHNRPPSESIPNSRRRLSMDRWHFI
jgi:hypothetical protein